MAEWVAAMNKYFTLGMDISWDNYGHITGESAGAFKSLATDEKITWIGSTPYTAAIPKGETGAPQRVPAQPSPDSLI